MHLATAFADINWLSVLVAALSAFILGGLWYGPLFGKAWMHAWGFDESDLSKQHPPKVFGFSFILSLIAAITLEMYVGQQATMMLGALAGLLAGLGWVSTMLGILYLFEMRPLKAYLINAGYCTIALTIMGLILGAW